MLKYCSNVFGMLGVALIATAFFRHDWQAGCMAGAITIILGAWLQGLAPANQRGKK